jgi:hypothetical protein
VGERLQLSSISVRRPPLSWGQGVHGPLLSVQKPKLWPLRRCQVLHWCSGSLWIFAPNTAFFNPCLLGFFGRRRVHRKVKVANARKQFCRLYCNCG